jgi:hypothetical protein
MPSLPNPFNPTGKPVATPALQNALTPQSPLVAVLVFIRHLSSPVVLFVDQPQQLYAELQQAIQQARPTQPKLIEKQAKGPLGLFSVLDTALVGVALESLPPQAQQA